MEKAPIKDTTSLSDPIEFGRQRTDCTIENLEAIVAHENIESSYYANLSAEEKQMKQVETHIKTTSCARVSNIIPKSIVS